MKSKSAGFSLLELLVGMVIVTIGLSAAIPTYLRNMRQGEVDRYTQQLEAGFFGLRYLSKLFCVVSMVVPESVLGKLLLAMAPGQMQPTTL